MKKRCIRLPTEPLRAAAKKIQSMWPTGSVVATVCYCLNSNCLYCNSSTRNTICMWFLFRAVIHRSTVGDLQQRFRTVRYYFLVFRLQGRGSYFLLFYHRTVPFQQKKNSIFLRIVLSQMSCYLLIGGWNLEALSSCNTYQFQVRM